ncbi:MAG: cobalamin-dependent protein [Thermoleophilia bacterium]
MNEERLRQITRAISDLEEKVVLDLVRQSLADGISSVELMRACERGMREVGERYARQEYFLSGLIMAGEIFRQVMVLVQPDFERQGPEQEPEFEGGTLGQVLLGTVDGDIHNIGKNMVRMALRSFGFSVHDLGVDVSPHHFLEKAIELRPDVIGLSCLLSTSYDSARNTIALFRAHAEELGGDVPVVIGGGIIDEAVRQYVGADYWTDDAIEGVRICQRIVSRNDS